MIRELRKYLYDTLEVPASEDSQGLLYDIFMMALITANAVAMIVGTVPWVQQQYNWFLIPFEIVSIAIFTIEYILLLWVCTVDPEYSDPVYGRIKYAMTPMALINLVSILPAFIPFLAPFDLRALRMFRIFRFFRVLKLTKYSDSLKTLNNAIYSKKELFAMTFLIIILLVVTFSILIFYAENGTNPSPAFNDIPSTLWWGFVKLSPISNESGYPETTLGKMIATGLALLEIAIFAIPAGIMANAFERQYENKQKDQEEQLLICEGELNRKKSELTCPHCGKPYTDEVVHFPLQKEL